MTWTDLPYVDEHTAAVDADAGDVWRSLVERLDGLGARPVVLYARAVGCLDTVPTGPRPLAAGSAVPGFHVALADPDRELVLEGRHRFSSYALAFRIEEVAVRRCVLRAETRAAFPGVHGAAYQLLVITSGAHAVAVRGMLAGIRRDAEQRAGRRP